MPEIYEVRHMFPAELSGGEQVFFTRDNEHRLEELSKTERDALIERGLIRVTTVTEEDHKKLMEAKTMKDSVAIEQEVLGEARAQQANVDAANARGADLVKGKREIKRKASE